MNARLQKIFHKLSLIGIGKERDFFMENFANLLLSGMSLIDSIEYVANEIKNPTLKKIMKAMGEDVRSGFALADAMERTEIFSAHVISLVHIGQTS